VRAAGGQYGGMQRTLPEYGGLGRGSR